MSPASSLDKFEKQLGYKFNDQGLLQQALTHRSYINEKGGRGDNQRLEFFGDAILEFEVSHRLYQRLPEVQEGELSRLRSRIVNTDSLARYAGDRLSLGQYLRLGRGEVVQGGRQRPSMLADAFEALLAALHLDGGQVQLAGLIDELLDHGLQSGSRDYKSRLQEYLQKSGNPPPSYKMLERLGPDHDPLFKVGVQLADGRLIAQAEGCSLKVAEQRAAEKALLGLDKKVKNH